MRRQDQLKGFYLDVSRYTYNYLDDSRLDNLVIKLANKDEKRIFKALIKNSFLIVNEKETDAVMFDICELGVRVRFIESDKGETYIDFVNMLYHYADTEDSRLVNLTEKRLFRESLDYGFNYLASK